VVTVLMILVTFIFIALYMLSSNVYFYGENSLEKHFNEMSNQTMPDDNTFRQNYTSNMAQQKLFFQYGMIGSVCITPVCAILELIAGKKRQGE
jgi:hypothetical protein